MRVVKNDIRAIKARATLAAARCLVARINQEIKELPEPKEPEDEIEFEIPSDISFIVPVTSLS